MKVALLADTHFGARGDSQLFLDYFTRFYREVFFPYIDDHGIKTIIHLGDLVDRRKFLTYTTANVMRKEYIEPSEERWLVTHMIAGNHDCSHKNSNEINALHEIVQGRRGFQVYTEPAELKLNSLTALMLPWISPENEKLSFDHINSTQASIVFAHLELIGFEMAKGQMMEHGMDAATFRRFKGVYTGHYHHKSSKGNIHYLGSPYEMTWADADDPKGFHVFDTQTLELEFIPNPFTLHKKLVITQQTLLENMAKYKGQLLKVIPSETVRQHHRTDFDQFIAALEGEAHDVQVIDSVDLDITGAQNIDVEGLENTMTIIEDFVAASDMQVDKKSVINLIREMYLEAQ